MTRIDSPGLNRSLADRAYDFLGDILLQAETEEMLKEIEQEKAVGSTAEMDAFFARQDAQNLKRIQRYFRRRNCRQFFTQTLPRIAQIAAVFIAVVALAGGAAFAASHTVRMRVMQLFYEPTAAYTSLRMAEDEEASFDVPVQWQGESYPAYLPADFYVSNTVSNWSENIIQYQSSSNPAIWLNFTELGPTVVANVDTENAAIEEVTVHGHTAMLATKNRQINLCWSDGERYYILSANGCTRDEVITIADSVKKIR